MSDIFEKNLQLLRKYQPNVFQKLNLYIQGQYKPINKEVQKILVANCEDMVINLLVVCENGQFAICDHEDPIGQSYEWIDKYIDPSNSSEIIFGMGFAFHLEVLITSFKSKRIFIIEPNMELFYQIIKVRNMELIIKNSAIILDEPLNTILHTVNNLFWETSKGGIQCQPFEVYAEMFSRLWDDLRSKFIKQAEDFNVNVATKRFFADLWIHNCIKNAGELAKAANAQGLVGRFKGMPGILVSAGPSLSKNMHLLRGLKDKAVIMAAGTAAAILDDNGIEPHFMVGIDASESEAEMHGSVKSSSISFIYSNQVAVGSLIDYKGPRIFMNYSMDEFTADFLKNAKVNSEMFLSGPSVANTTFDLLVKMGCDPIILVGQDLAYTNGASYSGEEKGIALKDEDIEKEEFIPVKDIYGNDVYTKLPMLTMKNWFETYFEKLQSRVEILNATEGGLNIEFAKNVKFEDVIREKEFKKADIDGLISGFYNECHFTDEVSVKLAEYKAKILEEVIKLEKLNKELLEIANLLRREVYHPNKDRKAFDRTLGRVNSIFDSILNSSIYSTVLKNLIEIEFYIIKREVESASKQAVDYKELKGIYLDAIGKQHSILEDKLGKLKKLLVE